MSKKNVVVIGYGGMGGWHAKYFTEKNSDCVNLLGIWDIKEERRQAAEEKGIHAARLTQQTKNTIKKGASFLPRCGKTRR